MKDVNRLKAVVKHRLCANRTYFCVRSAWRRCYNPLDRGYNRYGARGIKFASEWLLPDGKANYAAMIAYLGERPEGMTLDRIDFDGDYAPGNLRWATMQQQAVNRHNTILIEGRTVKEWAEETGLLAQTIAIRYRKGVRGEALFKPAERPRFSSTYQPLRKTKLITSEVG